MRPRDPPAAQMVGIRAGTVRGRAPTVGCGTGRSHRCPGGPPSGGATGRQL